ncbi:Hypothetical predicted protein [Cloeon dipterum]|uniref:Uncharacterized protein n=1 Tax=Cloeon dipterum TaxID=197152 RepID=A0A8S1DU35_9INSE|nr:Hypothetical predicted protein [Cloeon dipterum]
MPAWLDYQTEYLRSGRDDAVICGFSHSDCKIYLARTLHEGYYVPGFAFNGVGYFVSTEWQTFKTSNFQVLVNTFTRWVGYAGNSENGMVADAGVEESKRIKIGSFIINDMRFCGMVGNQYTCFINFFGQLCTMNALDCQVLVDFPLNGGIRFRTF